MQLDSARSRAGVAVPGDPPDPTGVRRLFGGVALVGLDTPPVLVAPELTGLRIFAGYAGWSPGQLEEEITPNGLVVRRRGRGATPSPTTRTTCGSVLRRQREPHAGWPGTRRTPRSTEPRVGPSVGSGA